MQPQFPVRRWRAVAAVIALLAGPIMGMVLNISPVHAAASAEPSEEIVYIDDANGVIHVLDLEGSPLVQWVSPTGGWRDIALGDVNGDNDLEILAIGDGSIAGSTKIAIFDPVVTSPSAGQDGVINGIPWATLYTLEVAGAPEIIVAGDFDSNIPGDEFLYSHRIAGDKAEVVVMNAASLGPGGLPTGRNWKVHVTYVDQTEGREWRYGAAGNINGTGSDEAVLIDSKAGDNPDLDYIMDVFDVDQGFKRIDGKSAGGERLEKIAVGQVIEDGPEELVESRSAKPGNDSLRVYRWDSGDAELTTDEGYEFWPSPRFVFLADLSGNGDQEVIFLRDNEGDEDDDDEDDDPGGRLVTVNDWGDDQDDVIDIADYLTFLEGGEDNEFKVGAGGDVDGDGRDEIIIASDSRIVVFPEPHRTLAGWAEYVLEINNDVIKVGDLDATPLVAGPAFGTDKSLVEAAIPTGTTGGDTAVSLSNVATTDNVDFYIIQDLPRWLNVSPLSGYTPSVLNFSFDATNLSIGVYRHTVRITSNADVTNKPYEVSVVLTVEPATLLFQPGAAGFTYFPCEPPVNITSTMEIEVGGTRGLTFHAAILPVPELGAAGATPLTGKITGGEIDNGVMVLYDEFGNSARLNTLSPASISAGEAVTWPHDVPWIVEATSPRTVVPSSVTLRVNPFVLGDSFDLSQAVMVFVADTRAGSPPDNVKVLPINVMCAQDVIRVPSLHR